MSFLKNILFIINLLSFGIEAQLVFLPFENKSVFEGTWELKTEIPNYTAAFLRETNSWNVIGASTFLSMSDEENYSVDLESLSKFLKENNFRYACGGKIETFSLARYILGEPTLAGYEGYSVAMKINFYLFDALTEQIIFNETIESTINRNGIGINLFGKPTTEKEQFYGLNAIPFGSEDFNKTIIGENFNLFLEKLNEKLSSLKKEIRQNFKEGVSIQDSAITKYDVRTKIVQGEILMFDAATGEAFINIGAKNEIKLNEMLAVYSIADSLYDPKCGEFLGVAEKKVAEIKIIEVRTDKLSLAIAEKKYHAVIQKGMIVKKILQ